MIRNHESQIIMQILMCIKLNTDAYNILTYEYKILPRSQATPIESQLNAFNGARWNPKLLPADIIWEGSGKLGYKYYVKRRLVRQYAVYICVT